MSISVGLIKKLRSETGAGVMDVRRALEEAGGNLDEAKKMLQQMGFEKAEKKSQREALAGLIVSYIHAGGSVGVLLELACETDFVAKTSEFQNLARELCLQIASMKPKNIEELLAQEYIRESQKKVQELVKEVVAKTGENIVVRRFTRYQLGE